MAIQMKPSEFVCRYYNREQECPFSSDAERHFWELERKAVEVFNPDDTEESELGQALWCLEREEETWYKFFAETLKCYNTLSYVPENISAYLCWELDGKPDPEEFRNYFSRPSYPKPGYIKTNDLARGVTKADIPTSLEGLFCRFYKGEERNPYNDPRHTLWDLERCMRECDFAANIRTKWKFIRKACRDGEFDKEYIDGYGNPLYCPEVPEDTTKAELIAWTALAIAGSPYCVLNDYINGEWGNE